MKRILAVLLLIATLLITTGCALKKPFKKVDAIDGTATVYVYRLPKLGVDATDYKLYVDGKYTHQLLKANEYFAFHIKEGKVTISAIANGILEHSVSLDLSNTQDYFLKVTPVAGDNFTIKAVQEAQALSEILTTDLSGSTREENPEETKLVKAQSPSTKQLSASDEITKLYEMKEKGIISQEEFAALKAKIITK